MERHEEIAIEVSLFNKVNQFKFLNELFSRLPEKRRIELAEHSLHIAVPRSRWLKIELWMERRFNKQYDMTPNQLAGICMNYMKINRKMRPLLIKLARRVKDRIRKRKKKGGYNGKQIK